MTLEEKISQLMNDSPAIDRLGVPAYNWWNECLHGVARAGRATVFPEAIGLAATWDTRPDASRRHRHLRRSPRQTSRSSSAAANTTSIRDSPSGPPTSISSATRAGDAAWRPTAKIPISPAAWPSQFIKGLQGDDPKYLKTIATAKHYAVHSGPESDAPHLRRRRQRAGPARNLSAALRSGHQGRRRLLGHVRLQPRRRPARLRQSRACSTTSSARSGASTATSSPIAAPSATSTATTNSSPPLPKASPPP